MKVVLLALVAVQYSSAVPTRTSDVVPETRFAERGSVNEGLKCEDAQPQAPRDLTTGASGAKHALGPRDLVPGHATATAVGFVHVNTHFHEGAEHKSDNYKFPPPFKGPDGGGYANKHPGWQCADSINFHRVSTTGMWSPYKFQHCKDVRVGNTYEIHYVHATGGPKDGTRKMSGGLGGALYETRNPSIIVQAQVYVVVNDDHYNSASSLLDFQHGKNIDVVAYTGSTTGTSFNNKFCSPYEVSWHVDRACHKVSAKSFDAMCQSMKKEYSGDEGEYMGGDLKPHGSRTIVSADWVAKSTTPMATY